MKTICKTLLILVLIGCACWLTVENKSDAAGTAATAALAVLFFYNPDED